MAKGIVDIPLTFDTSEADHTLSEFAKKCVKAFDNKPIDPFKTLDEDIAKAEAKIKELQDRLESGKGTQIPLRIDNSDAIAKVEAQIDELTAKSDKLGRQLHINPSVSGEENLEKINNEIEELNRKLKEFREEKTQAFEGSGEQALLVQELNNYQHILEALTAKKDELAAKTQKLGEEEKEETKIVRKSAEEHKKHASILNLSLSKIIGYALGIRSLYSVFSKLKAAAKEGLGYAANYSQILKNSVNQVTNSFTMMKAAVGAAISPLVNALAPIIAKLAVLFVQAANAVARFFAILSGRSSVIQAKTNLGAYSKAVGGAGKATADAAKDVKKSLAPFDDLNVLAEDTADNLDDLGSGAGGLGDLGSDMFETLDLETYDSDFLKKIKEWIDNLNLEPITKAWQLFTDALKRFLELMKNLGMWVLENVLLPLGKWLIESALPPILESIGYAIEIICDILEVLGDVLRPLWEDVLKPIFETLGDWIVAVLEGIRDALKDIHEAFQEMDPESAKLMLLGIGTVALLVGAFLLILRDAFSDTGDVIDDVANGPLPNVTGKFSTFFDLLGRAAIIVAVGFMLQGIADVIEALTGLIQTMNDTNTSAIDIFWLLIAVLAPLGLAIAALVAFIPADAAVKLLLISAAIELISLAIQGVLEAITDLIDRPIRTLMEFIEKSKEDIPEVTELIRKLMDQFKALVSEIKKGGEDIKTKLKSVGTEATTQSNVFKEAFEKMAKAVSNAASAISSTPIKPIIDTSSIDAGIAKLNTFLSLVAQAGSASASVGNFSLPGGKVPGLAAGGVLPPNQPFLAMLGDQKSGTNIEAPLDTIVEAMEQALGRSNYSGNQEIILNIDGTQLARITVPNTLNELNRQGYNVKVLNSK